MTPTPTEEPKSELSLDEPTDEEKRNWREAQLAHMRSGNRKQRRAAAKKLRRDMKRSGLPRGYAVGLSKRMVRKHG